MNTSCLRPIIAALATAVAVGNTYAQSIPATGNAPVQLRVATGKPGKGFSRVFADVQQVCGTVSLVEVQTEGGLQNLTALAANKADLGFVQVDTLLGMVDSDPGMAALQAVMPMNSNLLHVVARSTGYQPPRDGIVGGLIDSVAGRKMVLVQSMADLKGLPVAVVGSARALGREIDRRQALALQFVDVSTDEEGLSKLKRGEVAALFSTSGWPSGPVQALKRSDGLHLVAFDAKGSEPYQIVRRNYENIDAFKHPFLAAPNLLMTRPFGADGPYGKAVAALRDCLRKKLVALREGPYEPMWQEVSLDGSTYGVKVFAAMGR